MQVKVSLILGFMIVLPFILFEIWQFIKPGLLKRERMYLVPFLFFGTLFFIAGGKHKPLPLSVKSALKREEHF